MAAEIRTITKTLMMIQEIQKYPSLYDQNASDFSNKLVKKSIIYDICSRLFGDWEELSESDKKERHKIVLNRFRSLRTVYKKDLKAQKLSPNHRQWLYSPYLKWLEPYMYMESSRRSWQDDDNNPRITENNGYNMNENESQLEYESLEYPNDELQEFDVKPIVDEIIALNPERQHSYAKTSGQKGQTLNDRPQKKIKKQVDDALGPAGGGARIESLAPKALPETIFGSTSPLFDHVKCDEQIRKVIDNFIVFKRNVTEEAILDDEHGDRAFLMSLLSSMKMLPLQAKLEVRTNFLRVMGDALRSFKCLLISMKDVINVMELQREKIRRVPRIDYTKSDTNFAFTHFIFECGEKLGAQPLTVATAAIIMHRFLKNTDIKNYDNYTIASTTLYLAGKIKNDPIKIRDLINVSRDTIHKGSAPLELSEEYWNMRDAVVQAELLILRVVKFQTNLVHPHQYMLHYLCSLENAMDEIEWRKVPLCRASANFLQDFHHSVAVLDYKPQHIAIACISLAIQTYGVQIPLLEEEGNPWYSVFVKDLSKDLHWEITEKIMQVYNEH